MECDARGAAPTITLDVEESRARDDSARIQEWEQGEIQKYRAVRLERLFCEQASRCPDAIAVIDDLRVLTYRQLNRDSDRLAGLLKAAGLRAGSLVAVCMGRSSETIVALLAILKAGAAYVPVEPSWPIERITSVLRRLNTNIVMADEGAIEIATAVAKSLDQPVSIVRSDGQVSGECMSPGLPTGDVTADDIAYVIFTSGSTGVPKGVAVQHRPVCNLIAWARRTFAFDSRDRVLWVTSLGFDLSVFDIFGILTCGASIRIASQADLARPSRLLNLLATEPITFWNSTPQTFEQLRGFLDRNEVPKDADFSRLRLVFLSGDWIPLSLPGLIRNHFPNAKTISLGGATEATVWSNYYEVGEIQPRWRSIPYGRPIQNARYYILDENHDRCGIGVAGELYIAGCVLASHYAGDAAQTCLRFLPDPFCADSSGRMYRTGDSARWSPDGNIELLGRLDDQVKVRGYRIELGEVEQALRRHPDLLNACVVAHRTIGGENQLIAYVVARTGSALSRQDFRSFLQQLLPEYMIPAAFVALDALPVTANGKVDRRTLCEMNADPIPRRREHRRLHNSAEIKLGEIFTRVLGINGLSAEDNFFELGGDSLSALSAIFAAEQEGFAISIETLRSQNLRHLAMAIAPSAPRRLVNCDNSPGVFPLAPNQRWILERRFENPASYSFSVWLGSDLPLDPLALSRAWQATVDHHESLRICFHRAGDDICQSVMPRGVEARVTFQDWRGRGARDVSKQIEALAQSIASGAKLFDAVLPQLACVRTSCHGDLLFLFIPHIITDGYSARIVIDDLASAYLAAGSQRPITLPETTTPFSQWCRDLHALSHSSTLENERRAFFRLPWRKAKRLPRDFTTGENSYASRDLINVIPVIETERLLNASRKIGISMGSVLIAVLVKVIAEWAGMNWVLIDITGAGRDRPLRGNFLHRSTGLLSTVHPVILHRGEGEPDARYVEGIDDQLQNAPGRGHVHGVLQYSQVRQESAMNLGRWPQPEIKFNFHGKQALGGAACTFQRAEFASPNTMRPTDQRRYLFNIEITVNSNCLTHAWKYPSAIYRTDTVRMLIDDYQYRLSQLANTI